MPPMMPSLAAAPDPTAGLKMAPDQSTEDSSDQTPNANPIVLNVKISAQPAELEAAISVLKEAGMDDIAKTLEDAVKGQKADPNADSTQELTDSISAMGNNPHGM